MINKEVINYTIRNLKKRKTRGFLTVFSIFLGITTIFILISFGLGLYAYVNKFTTSGTADKIMVQPKGIGAPGIDTTFKLTDSDIETIRKTRGVIEATGTYTKPVEIYQKGKRKYALAISYDPEKPILLEFFGDITIEKGRYLKKDDSGKVLLGYNYMIGNKIFPKALDINEKIEVNGVELRIVGFMQQIGNPQDDAQIYLTNDYFKELFDNNISYSMIIVKADKNEIKETAQRIRESLRHKRNQKEGKEDFNVQTYEEALETFTKALDIIIIFILVIALISVLVSAINTANTMITSVLERYKEIGILKSIGARNSDIFKIFLFESGLLGFIAGSLGVIFGYILSNIAGHILKELGWGFLNPIFPIELFVGCIFFATITGAISGVIPAYRASKINPVEALRYE